MLLGEPEPEELRPQGQTRTAAISLKLAQRVSYRRDRREEPVLLLDDVLGRLTSGGRTLS